MADFDRPDQTLPVAGNVHADFGSAFGTALLSVLALIIAR
jgi:hypothetical protein